MRFSNAWLTITHNCNLNCEWCYDKNNIDNSRYMNLQLAYNIIALLSDAGCKSINLIGGEPSLHPDVDKIIEYATNYGIKTYLITNGILLSDKKFLKSLLDKGLEGIYLSYKGKDNYGYRTDNYRQILAAMRNMDEFNIKYVIDMVLTSQNIDKLKEWIKELRVYTNALIHLSICKPAIGDKGVTNSEYIIDPKVLIEKFQELYQNDNEFENEKFILHQTLPICWWDDKIIERLKNNNQIGFGCQLLCRNGIIFDVDGEVLVCNGLAKYPYGKYGESFDNKSSMQTFYEQEDINDIFREICRLPDLTCTTCGKLYECRGGCAMQWFAYTFI